MSPPDEQPVGWAELAKPNLLMRGVDVLHVGQRYAFAQPTRYALVKAGLRAAVWIALILRLPDIITALAQALQ
jgi:hypothetical protein